MVSFAAAASDLTAAAGLAGEAAAGDSRLPPGTATTTVSTALVIV